MEGRRYLRKKRGKAFFPRITGGGVFTLQKLRGRGLSLYENTEAEGGGFSHSLSPEEDEAKKEKQRGNDELEEEALFVPQADSTTLP